MTQCLCGVRQGSVLGPLLFTAYVSPIVDLIESFGVSYHQFADDTQLFIAMNACDVAPALESLARCSAAVSVSVAQLVNATVHATGTGGQTTLRFSSGDVWFAY